MNNESNNDKPQETLESAIPGSADRDVTEFSLSPRKRSWKEPVAIIAIGLLAMGGYFWYRDSRYDLPKLKPYAGAESDLFTQMKCLVDYTEDGKITPNVDCRFKAVYDSFWLRPKSLDSCLTYSTDNAVAAFDSPKRIEFDFMCEGNDMRAVFPYENGQYRLKEIGKTFAK